MSSPDETLLWTKFDPRDPVDPNKLSYRFAVGKGETPNSNTDAARLSLITDVNIALALNRPLLLTGGAGVGKSTVARGIADLKKWSLLKLTVNSSTDAEDLKARYDHLRQLSDSHSGEKQDSKNYVDPGALWLARAPNHAKGYVNKFSSDGSDRKSATLMQLADIARVDATPPHNGDAADLLTGGRVLLIDEIDKGDLDFANNLLDAFDTNTFTVPFAGKIELQSTDDSPLLIIITSNGEQDLSKAFLRRCIPHEITAPTTEEAVEIAKMWQHANLETERNLSDTEIADLVILCKDDGGYVNPARMVDILEAARQLPDNVAWEDVRPAMAAFQKRRNAAMAS